MFVLHVDTFKACAMFVPRSRAVKKPYGASLKSFHVQVLCDDINSSSRSDRRAELNMWDRVCCQTQEKFR